MSWIEILLIVLGVSLDIFAAVACQGALVAKVNKKHLSLVCILIAVWQVLALMVGHLISFALYQSYQSLDEALVGEIIAVVIYWGLAIRLFVKAFRNDNFNEHLETNLGIKRFVRMCAATTGYTVLAGIAFGLLGTSIYIVVTMIVALTVLVVILGMYTGYHFGFEPKKKAYCIGAVLLVLAGADIVIRCILQIYH